MKRAIFFVAVAVIAACGTSDRAHDCAQARDVLVQPKRARVTDERRYWERQPVLFDPAPTRRLGALEWRDAEVRAAVHDVVDATGWTAYSPYATDLNGPLHELAALCDLHPPFTPDP
jgi:hypothetical protein